MKDVAPGHDIRNSPHARNGGSTASNSTKPQDFRDTKAEQWRRYLNEELGAEDECVLEPRPPPPPRAEEPTPKPSSDDADTKSENRWQEALDRAGARSPHLRVALNGSAFTTAAEEGIDWMWDGYIAKHHQVELCGTPGHGKTTLAALIIVAFAAPEPLMLLGRKVVPVDAGRFVMLIEEENGRESISGQLVRAVELLGLDQSVLDRVVVFARQGVRASKDNDIWTAIFTRNGAADAGLIGALFLDSRARILVTEGGANSEDQAQIGSWLTKLTEKSGAPIITLGHGRKGGVHDIDDVAGHHQRGAIPDAVLGVTAKKDGGGRVEASTLRVIKYREIDSDRQPDPITYSIERDHDTGRWMLDVGASSKVEDAPVHERVHRLLCTEGALDKSAIAKRLGLSGKTLNDALDVLRAERRIVKVGERKARNNTMVPIFAAAKPSNQGDGEDF